MISGVSELHFNFPALFQEVRQVQFQDFPGNQIGVGGGGGRPETVDNVGENVVTSLFVLNFSFNFVQQRVCGQSIDSV